MDQGRRCNTEQLAPLDEKFSGLLKRRQSASVKRIVGWACGPPIHLNIEGKTKMYCPKCRAENPDNAPVCSACGAQLSPPPVPPAGIVPRTSNLAVAAFALGIAGVFTFGLTALPAVVLGIVAIILIERSGGRLTGRNFAVLGIVMPVLFLGLMFIILMPALSHQRQHALRMVCGTNLMGIGKAMLIYANEYDGQFPRSAGKGGQWAMRIPDWGANNRYLAYGLATDSSGGRGTISSCFYLLVKHTEVTPKSFICPGDSRTREFKPAKYAFDNAQLADLWDFGPEPAKHCSYSYHLPFSLFPLTTSSEPGMAVAADRNPWIASPASDGKAAKFAQFNPVGGREAIKIGNAPQHQEDGQNVLFMDNHVNFEKNAFCGVNDDNIYTFWDGADIRKGARPVGRTSEPMNKLDSFLVHDGL